MLLRFSIAVLIMLLGLSSCTQAKLIGHFTSNPKSKMGFAGTSIQFNADSTFSLRSWTDSYTVLLDQNGNQICDDIKFKGDGVFKVKEDSICLVFTNEEFVLVQIEIKNELVDSILTKLLFVNVTDELERPLPVPIMILNKASETLDYKNFQEDGFTYFELDSYLNPTFIKVEFFGSTDLWIDITKLNQGHYEFTKDRCFGYFERNDEIQIWYKLKGGTLFLEFNNKTHKLKRIQSKA